MNVLAAESQVKEEYLKFIGIRLYLKPDLTNHLTMFLTSNMLIVFATLFLAERNIKAIKNPS